MFCLVMTNLIINIVCLSTKVEVKAIVKYCSQANCSAVWGRSLFDRKRKRCVCVAIKSRLATVGMYQSYQIKSSVAVR